MEETVTDEIKANFFQHVKNSNVTEILSFFRKDNLKPWLFKEEEEYTGLYIFIKHFIELLLWILL